MPTWGTKQIEDQQFPSSNTVWCPEKCWWDREFSPLTAQDVTLLPTVKVMSSYIFSLVDSDECSYLRCLLSWALASLGVLPLPPRRSQSGRLIALAPEVCLRKGLLILSRSLLVSATDSLGLSGTPNWTVKTCWAVWYITVDTDRPRDTIPPPCFFPCASVCRH